MTISSDCGCSDGSTMNLNQMIQADDSQQIIDNGGLPLIPGEDPQAADCVKNDGDVLEDDIQLEIGPETVQVDTFLAREVNVFVRTSLTPSRFSNGTDSGQTALDGTAAQDRLAQLRELVAQGVIKCTDSSVQVVQRTKTYDLGNDVLDAEIDGVSTVIGAANTSGLQQQTAPLPN